MRFTLPLLLSGALLALAPHASAQDADLAGPASARGIPAPNESKPLPAPANHFGGGPLYDNGPLVNSIGTGPLGEDESILQNLTLALTTFGANVNYTAGFRIADDFIVPAGGWDLDQMVFYSYQTGSGTTSTITGVYVEIYDGRPDDPASTVVWGDSTTNRMASTSWPDIYRRTEAAPGNTDRPVMEVVANVDVDLPAGTYWVSIGITGSTASGPWQPPVTITGQTVTGNALQRTSTFVWQDWVDGGTTQAAQGMPFLIYGTSTTANEGGPRVAGEFALAAPAPNPAASSARVGVEVERAQVLSVVVYDALGRQVATLHEGMAAAGRLALTLDASALPAGAYLVRATGETGAVSARLTVVR